MKKLLTLMSLAAMTLTGCLKSTGGYDKELEQVMPGIYIYNGATNQNTVGLQQANVALRFAMLQAEAAKAGKGLTEVTVGNNVNLFKGLFGNNASLADKGTGVYEIVLSSSDSALGFFCSGTFVVNTRELTLDNANTSSRWEVSLKSDGKILYSTGSGSNALNIYQSGGTTEIYHNGGKSYAIQPIAIVSYVSGYESRVSNWSGMYNWDSAADNLAYTDNAGKQFGFAGQASGATFNSFDNSSPTKMTYRIIDGKYQFGRLVNGGEYGSLSGFNDYSQEAYPSPNVTMDTSMSGEGSTKRITQILKYNGFTYTNGYNLTVN